MALLVGRIPAYSKRESKVNEAAIPTKIPTNHLPETLDEANALLADVREQLRRCLEAEAALRQSEEETKALLDANPDGIFRLNRAGDYLSAKLSSVFKSFVVEDQLVGNNVADVLPDGLALQRMDTIARTLDSDEDQVIDYSIMVEGEARDREARFFRVGTDEVLVIVRDITERKVADQQLRLQATALDSAANGVVITDREGAIQWVNPAFIQMTGYSLEEAVGQNPRDLVKSGKHNQAFYQDLWQTILAGKTWFGEIVNRRKDGSLYHEEQTITPVINEQGEITHYVAIKLDITARMEAEERTAVKVRELACLNQMFQEHLRWRDDVEKTFTALFKKMGETVTT